MAARRIDEATQQEIYRLRASGLPIIRIAELTGTNCRTVTRYGNAALDEDWPPLPTPDEIAERSLWIRAERDERRWLRLCPQARSHIAEPQAMEGHLYET